MPWLPEALRRVKAVELRGLSKAERASAVRGSLASEGSGPLSRECVLLVDDVITYGSTFREAARVLAKTGVSIVLAAGLSHTEG